MLRIVKKDVNFNFVSKFKTFGMISASLVVISLILALAVLGLNFGIDFKGGTNIVYQFDKTPNVDSIRKMLKKANIHTDSVNSIEGNKVSVQISRTISLLTEKEKLKLKELINTKYASKGLKTVKTYPNRVRLTFDKPQDKVALLASIKALKKDLGTEKFEVIGVKYFGADEKSALRIFKYDISLKTLSDFIQEHIESIYKGKVTVTSLEQVGSKVGDKLKQDGTYAMLLAILAILFYISFRFDSRFAPGAVVALVHDVSITLGIFAVFQIEFNLPVIAALLTIIGYSLNDTIVIFDKLREVITENKMNKKSTLTLGDMINQALNLTLSRTLLTSLTTLAVVASMLVLGGEGLLPFAIALLVGVTVGTYSSLFIASPVYLYLENRNIAKLQKLEEANN